MKEETKRLHVTGTCCFSDEQMSIILALTEIGFRGGIVSGRKGYELLAQIEDVVLSAGGKRPSDATPTPNV